MTPLYEKTVTWFYDYDARPRWRSALFPRYTARVSAGWIYVTFGVAACGLTQNLKGWGLLLWLAAFAVEVYGIARVWVDG